MTTHDTVDAHYVTDDPDVLADLMARVDDLDSHELAEDDETAGDPWESARPGGS